YGPTVDAGPPVEITQPTDSAMLSGTVTAGDNPISQTMWVQVSGPQAAVIDDPTNVETAVTALVPGKYVFRLSAIDTDGRVASDMTTVTVVAADLFAYYWNQDDNTVPTIEDILMKSQAAYVSGQP